MDHSTLHIILSGEQKLNDHTRTYLESLVVKYPYFQLAWILYLKNLKEIGAPEYEQVLKKVASRIPDRQQLYKFLNTGLKVSSPASMGFLTPGYSLKGDPVPQSGDSLIDRFLSGGSTKIGSGEGHFDKVSSEYVKKIVDQSVVENEEIVTEALAMIYFEQKNYKKAQEAYQKLSLKYPEKSVYFATRIKEIEKLKNL